MGNERTILPITLVLPIILVLLVSIPGMAWQVTGQQDRDTIALNTLSFTIPSPDSLPDLKSLPAAPAYLKDLENHMDSVHSWKTRFRTLQFSADSLSPAQLRQITALKQNGDSLLTSFEAKQQQAEQQLNQLTDKTVQLQDSIHTALRQKIEELRGEGRLSAKADSLWQRLNHPMATRKLTPQPEQLAPSVELEALDHPMKEANIGEVDELINELGAERLSPGFTDDMQQKLSSLKGHLQQKEQLAAVNTQIAGLKSAFKEEFEQFNQKTDPQWLQKQQGQLQRLKDYSNELKTYSDQVSNAPETLEQRARELEEVQAFESQKAAFSPYQQQMEGLREEDYAKEQLTQQVKTRAKDHFAGHQEKLKAAQGRLTKLKQQMGRLGGAGGGLNGEKPQRQNPLKGKSLGERLVLGGNFQLHPGDHVSLDVSPALAYRWTKMFRLGVGGTYRTTFDDHEKFFLSDENEVFGYRGFAEHDIYQGFFGHVEYERLKGSHGLVQNSTFGDDEGDPWQTGALVGVGKRYTMRNKIKGTVMLLYNFMFERSEGTAQQAPTNLYRGPWNLRFGFELVGQDSKKQKKGKAPNATGEKQKE